jgi:acyl-CoA-binding protein
MSAIHIMEADHSHEIMLFEEVGIASPAMFLIGTHADKLKEKPGLLERQEELLKKKLEDTVLANHVIWASKANNRMCFYVDNTLTNPSTGTVDAEVVQLRQMTEEVARRVAQWHKLPVTWLKFEQEARDIKALDKTRKTATVEDLFHLAKKAAGIKTREEFEVLLHYLSNRAVLLYRPKALKSVEEKVILDVEWLISQLEKIITIHADVPPKLQRDVVRSRKKGIMTAGLIRHLLSESKSTQHLIISLMNHFDLLCQYMGYEAGEFRKSNNERDFLCLNAPKEDTFDDICTAESCDYFIPCLLEKSSSLESQQISGTQITMPLLISSAPLCIP